MYLKSLKVENYRKFRNLENILEVAYQKGEKERPNVAENTTLIVGRNNTGKTTVIELLDKLSNSKSGDKLFNVHDFNLNYLQSLYNSYLDEEGLAGEVELPYLKFRLVIGIDNFEENSLANFENILILKNVYKQDEHIKHGSQKEKALEVIIDVKYQCREQEKLVQKLTMLKTKYEKDFLKIPNLDKMDISTEKINSLDKILTNKTLKDYIHCGKDNMIRQNIPELFNYIDYCKSQLFENFLSIIDNASFKLMFYPEDSNEEAEKFSLSKLLEVKMVKANNINGENGLSNAYNKIIKTFIANMGDHDQEKVELEELLNSMNFGTKKLMDKYYTKELNTVVQKIESSSKLEMNLMPGITMNHILRNSIKYEYMENQNHIPEKQFGLGYTNLMVILAELVDYINFYKEENYSNKINIICIEEPETYMHPQMQEIFITNIEDAIDTLYQNKNVKNQGTKKINYQLIISTHSPHILNSKIHTGNTFNNINYLSFNQNKVTESLTAKIVPLSDNGIISEEVMFDGELDMSIMPIETINNIEDYNVSSIDSLIYIKKHMRIETSNLLFADAVIIVEGPTEEAYFKYLVSEHDKLSKFYITILNINGAYGKVYFNLIQKLGIPCILYTDMDYKRIKVGKNGEKSLSIEKKYPQICNLLEKTVEKSTIENSFTTNSTLMGFLFKMLPKSKLEEIQIRKSELEQKRKKRKKDNIQDELPKTIWEKNEVSNYFNEYRAIKKEDNRKNEYFLFQFGKLSVLTQGKINEYYATSLEEAMILENYDSDYLNDKLRMMMPTNYSKVHSTEGEKDFGDTKKHSFYFQSKIGESKKKTQFMNTIIFDEIIHKNNRVEEDKLLSLPRYLEVGLEILADALIGGLK